jgi:CheY-like chemotaxis protein/two-component sensor histidine kinase
MIYAGNERESVGVIDVSQAAREMVQLLRVSISKHAVLETDFGENLPAVRASAGQIQQIVMNLVTNASEALADRDGVIRVRTKSVTVDRRTEISRDVPEADYVQLEVSDNGSGMTLAMQAKVFDPFFTTKAGGHGLGLAVVEGMVRALDGVIRIASEPGKGTTFQILLPPAKTICPAPEQVRRAERVSIGGTALVVEDENTLRAAVARMLRSIGFEVLEAADGTTAIDLLRSGSRIDVMLLDMSLPGRSSREVLAASGGFQPALKVVLTSAYPEELVRGALDAVPTCHFIRKPFRLRALSETLQDALLG